MLLLMIYYVIGDGMLTAGRNQKLNLAYALVMASCNSCLVSRSAYQEHNQD